MYSLVGFTIFLLPVNIHRNKRLPYLALNLSSVILYTLIKPFVLLTKLLHCFPPMHHIFTYVSCNDLVLCGFLTPSNHLQPAILQSLAHHSYSPPFRKFSIRSTNHIFCHIFSVTRYNRVSVVFPQSQSFPSTSCLWQHHSLMQLPLHTIISTPDTTCLH